MKALNPCDEITVTVTTLSGHVVQAPLSKWIAGLILARPPDEVAALCELVAGHAIPPHGIVIADPKAIIRPLPANPDEFLRMRK